MEQRLQRTEQPGAKAEQEGSSSALWRQAEVLLGGTIRGLGRTLEDRLVNHTFTTLAEITGAALGGYALARMQGGTRMLKFGAQVIGAGLGYSFFKDIGGRASTVAEALADAGRSGQNLEKDKEIIAKTVAPFLFDTVITAVPGIVGAKLGASTNYARSLEPALREKAHDSVFRLYDGEGTGTGFALKKDGLVGTAFHAVDDVPVVALRSLSGRVLAGRPIAALPAADVALVQAEVAAGAPLSPWTLAESTTGLSTWRRFPGAAIGVPGTIRLEVKTGFFTHNTADNTAPLKYLSTVGELTAARNTRVLEGLDPLPGMSGGPLVNDRNEVVGVVTAKSRSFLGKIFGGNGIYAPVENLSRLMSMVERAKVPGAAVNVTEAAARLKLSPGDVMSRVDAGQLEGFMVPRIDLKTNAAGNGELADKAPFPWEWKVLVDKLH